MLAQGLITANRARTQNVHALLGFTKFPSSPLMDRRFTLARIDHDSRLLPLNEYGPCFSSVGTNSSFEFVTDLRLGVPLPHQQPLGSELIFQRVFCIGKHPLKNHGRRGRPMFRYEGFVSNKRLRGGVSWKHARTEREIL